LQLFPAVKNLYLTKKFAPEIARVLRLQDLAGERAVVLPTLEKVFIVFRISGSVDEAMRQLAAARQLSGHPILIAYWDKGQGITQDGGSHTSSYIYTNQPVTVSTTQ